MHVSSGLSGHCTFEHPHQQVCAVAFTSLVLPLVHEPPKGWGLVQGLIQSFIGFALKVELGWTLCA
eukprot:48616-Amphidinium_carterae.1